MDDPSSPNCSFSLFGQKYTKLCPFPSGVPHSGNTSPRPVRVGKTRYSCWARSRSIRSMDCLGRAVVRRVIHVDRVSTEVAMARLKSWRWTCRFLQRALRMNILLAGQYAGGIACSGVSGS